MRSGILILLALGTAACSNEVPAFLGREGGGDGIYTFGGTDLPVPVRLPLRQAVLEQALHGVIVRAESVAPTQGYYTAQLRPLGGGAPDAAGIVSFEMIAYPPGAPEATGPERTRILTAAVFMPNLTLRDVRGFRVAGVNQAVSLTVPAAAR